MALALLGGSAVARAVKGGEPALSWQLPPKRPAELAPPPSGKDVLPPVEAGEIATQPIPAGPAAPDADTGADSCLALLRAAPGNDVEAADPRLAQNEPACRVSEPVIVRTLALRIPGRSQTVSFQPPVTLSCPMAKAVADWLGDSIQPLTRGHFDADLSELRVGGGHECRRRNRASAGPVSEHATGKALDIFAFRLGEGKAAVQVVVEKPEGPVQSRFLTAVRQSACGAFMTALGPGSDAAHANHLHVDVQERRSRSSHFCQ